MSMARIRNVLGMWKGDTEPDRLVMLGSRMARVESSRNPTVQWRSLGQLLEQSVAFRKLIRQHGWRPRRSLAFAFWEADEHNAVGASEWVEQHAALLGNEAVLYVHNGHVDGTDFEPHASPLVSTSLKEVASMVNLEGTSTTLKSAWDKRNSTPKHHLRTWPLNVIGQSDDGPFAFTAAVPTVTVSFGVSSVQLPHSGVMGSLLCCDTMYNCWRYLRTLITAGYICPPVYSVCYGVLTVRTLLWERTSIMRISAAWARD
ncbi:uncharacterized protein LOC144171694 [Haemaphysalis longicornis]